MYWFGEHEYWYTEEYGHRGIDYGMNKQWKPDKLEFDNCEVNMCWEIENTDHKVYRHEIKTQEVHAPWTPSSNWMKIET